MASTAIRERLCTLRYRNLLVRQMVRMKIKTSALLMEAGVSYNKQRLHKAGYFRELLATNPDIDEGLCSPLRLCRETVVRLGKTESALVRSLERDWLLVERVERLMTIPDVGPITALTWALEVGDVQRFYEDNIRPSEPDQARVAAHAETIIYFACQDVDGAYATLSAQGIAASEPKVAYYGMKQTYVTDPDGYTLCFQWPVGSN